MAKKVTPTPPKAKKGLKVAETNVAAEKVEQTAEQTQEETTIAEDKEPVEDTTADTTSEETQEDTNADAQENEAEAEVNEDLPAKEEAKEPAAEDDTTDIDVDLSAKPEVTECHEEKTKIRLRVDHSCCIAMERYDFVAGKVYTVPKNVKRVLNRAGLLAPL